MDTFCDPQTYSNYMEYGRIPTEKEKFYYCTNKILPNSFLSKLTAHVDEIIGNYYDGFRLEKQIFSRQILKKSGSTVEPQLSVSDSRKSTVHDC